MEKTAAKGSFRLCALLTDQLAMILSVLPTSSGIVAIQGFLEEKIVIQIFNISNVFPIIRRKV
jgi:hypothetical protein